MRSLRASIFLRILPSLFPSPRVFPRAKKASGDILIDRLGFPSRVQINIQNRWSIEHFAQIEQEIWLTVHASLAAPSHLHLFIRSFRNDNARLISNYNAQTTNRTFVNKHTSFALQPRPLQHFPNIFSLSRLEENNSAEDKIKGDEQANILWAGIATTAAATSSQCRPFTHTHTHAPNTRFFNFASVSHSLRFLHARHFVFVFQFWKLQRDSRNGDRMLRNVQNGI